jgi:type IV secretory pathway VirB9-like protein
MQKLKAIAIALMLATLPSVVSHAQTASRNVSYHSQDIVPIRAKLKYTTLIVIPATEKIMEAATGDKDFWIVDVVGNFCFVHQLQPQPHHGQGQHLQLHLD